VLKLAGGGGGSGGILRAAISVEFAGRCDSVIYLQINLRFVSYVELAASFGCKNRQISQKDEIRSDRYQPTYSFANGIRQINVYHQFYLFSLYLYPFFLPRLAIS
jgi:hypothetical protein